MTLSSSPSAADVAGPIMGVSKQRRRPPSPQEQARREAWGHKTGAAVKDAYNKLLSAEGQR